MARLSIGLRKLFVRLGLAPGAREQAASTIGHPIRMANFRGPVCAVLISPRMFFTLASAGAQQQKPTLHHG
jgi:hypothetical protein